MDNKSNPLVYVRAQLVNGSITFTYVDCFILSETDTQLTLTSAIYQPQEGEREFRSFTIDKRALNEPCIEIMNRFGGYRLVYKDQTMQNMFDAAESILKALETELNKTDQSALSSKSALLKAVHKYQELYYKN